MSYPPLPLPPLPGGPQQTQPVYVPYPFQQQGGSNLALILQRGEKNRHEAAYRAALDDYRQVTAGIAQQIDGGDIPGAFRQLARQRYELALKHGDAVAAEVTKPGFDYVQNLLGLSDVRKGRAVIPAGEEKTRGVPLSQMQRNRAQEGLYGEQAQTERTMRPLIESGQVALTEQRGASAQAAQANAGYRSFQTQQLGPEQVETERARQKELEASAETKRNPPPRPGAGPNQYGQQLKALQDALARDQDVLRGGLGMNSQRIQQRYQQQIDALNETARREGRSQRVALGVSQGRVALVPGQPDRYEPNSAAQPSPGPSGATEAALLPEAQAEQPAPGLQNLMGQGAGTGRYSQPPPTPQAPQATPESVNLPPTELPQQQPARGPSDVGDLSQLIPESLPALQRGQYVSALKIRNELAKAGVTDERRIDSILADLARRFAPTPGATPAAR